MYRLLPSIRYSRSFLAQVMLLVLFALSVGAVYPVNFLDDFKERVSYQKSFCVNDEGHESNGLDFKPPKHSFVDYSCFFGCSATVPFYAPVVTALIFFEPFKAVPQQWPDILAPPHPLV